MRLIVGCPVAHRAWALPRWFECLAAQTRRPDGFAFIHSGQINDDTWQAINRESARHGFTPVAIRHDPRPAHPRHDSERFRTLADLRNQLVALTRDELHADLLLSLDTDVMLENPGTVEHLEWIVTSGEADIAAAATFLHPAASNPPDGVDVFWAYNAGWWRPGGSPEDPRRAWVRPEPDTIAWGTALPIHIPMAVWLGNRTAMGCEYRWHESGEDLGFAQDLDRRSLRVIWDTSLRARHIWAAEDLRPAEVA